MKKLIQYLLLLILFMGLPCVVVVMLVYSFYYPNLFSFSETIWLLIPFWLIYVVCKYRLLHDRLLVFKSWKILSIGYAMLNLLMIIVLLTFNTQPVSDYMNIWNVAREMADGDFNINNCSTDSYEYIYNWQLGISAFEGLIVKVFGANFYVLKILNLIIINVTAYLVFYISRYVTSLSVAKCSFLLFCSYYPIFITVGQFTNQHLASLLILMTLFFLNKGSVKYVIVAGFVAALLNVIRPMGILLLLTCVCFYIYQLIQKVNWKNCFSMVALFLVSYFVTLTSFDRLFIELEYADSPISKAKIGYFKFDKGLTGYNAPDLTPFDGDIDAFNDWQKNKVISQVIERPVEVAVFVANKMCRYLGSFDFKFEHTYNHDESIWLKHPIKACYIFGWGQYLFLLIFAVYGYNLWRKKNDVDVFQIFFIGNTLVYVFIEAFSSYRYESYPILIIYAGYGFYHYIIKKKNSNHHLIYKYEEK